MKYIHKKGQSLHYQRDFPRRLQHITGRAFYRRLKLSTDSPLDIIEHNKLALDLEFEHLLEIAEQDNTHPQLIQNLIKSQKQPLKLGDVWQEYLKHRQLRGKALQIAENDWARFIRISGNFECNNSNQTAQLIMQALKNHADIRLRTVKPSTIKRELSLVVAALNFYSKRNSFHWRAHSPELPKARPTEKVQIDEISIQDIIKALGNDTSCTDVDAVILLAINGVSPSEIARIRHNDIEPSTFRLHIRNKHKVRSRTIDLEAYRDNLQYHLDGAINLCNMSKGYVSRMCSERLSQLTNKERITLQLLLGKATQQVKKN